MSCSQPVGVFRWIRLGVALAVVTACASGQPSRSNTANQVSDPLPSWNEGPAKRAISDFVTRVTAQGMKDDWKTIYPPENMEMATGP